MHTTLVKPASAALLVSLITTAIAASASTQPAQCTEDAIYKGFFSNAQIAYDVNTLCVSDLGLTQPTECDHTVTARTTIYPDVTITGTTTSTLTTYDSTLTVMETTAVLGLKQKKREAAPDPTPMPRFVRDVLDAGAIEKRQTAGFDGSAAAYAVYSACSCGYEEGLIDPGTNYLATCTGSTITVTDDVLHPVATTAFITVDGGATTITVTQNMTSNILSVISQLNTSTSTSTPTWTDSWTGSWTGSWKGTGKRPWTSSTVTTTTTTSSVPASIINSTSSASSTANSSTTLSPVMTNLTSTSTSISTSPMTSSTIMPSGCPGLSGSKYTSSIDSCSIFEYECGLSYAPQDFYNSEEYYPSPETCSSVCVAENAGTATPCLGIVWNTTATSGSPNCRQIMSTETPITDPAAIALIYIGMSPSCQKNVSTSSSSNVTGSPTASSNTTMSSPIWTGTANYTNSRNRTWSYPIGTGSHLSMHSYNHTRTQSSTVNATMTGNTTSSYPTSFGTGTGSVGPIMTSNSSCLASTVFFTYTQYATLVSNFTETVPTTIFAYNTTTITVTTTRTKHATSTTTDIEVSTVISVSTVFDVSTVSVTTTVAYTNRNGRYANHHGAWRI